MTVGPPSARLQSRLPPRAPRLLIAFMTEAGLTAASAFLITVLAARNADIADFGKFAFILAIASVQQTLAAFGMQQLLYGRAAARPRRPTALAWSAVVVASGLATIFYGGTLVAMALFSRPDLAVLYSVAGLRVLSSASRPLTSDAQGRNAVQEYVPLRALTLTTAMAAALTAWWANASLVVFAAIWGTETFLYAAALLGSATRRRRLRRPVRPRYAGLLAKAAPIAVQSVFIILYYRFDQIYVQLRFGEVALGVYAAAARLAEAGNLLSQVFVLMLAPILIRNLRMNGQLSRRILFVLLAAGAASFIASGLSLLVGAPVLETVFGRGFGAGATILSIYVLSTCFVAYGGLGSRALAAEGISSAQISSGVAGGVVNVVLSVVLGEVLGSAGVAVATVISYAVAASILWWPLIGSTGSRVRRLRAVGMSSIAGGDA